jgi:hypothetical protein
VGLVRDVRASRRMRRMSRRLARLSVGARQELLRVLASPCDVRADLIRQMCERAGTRDLAEVLMGLEAEPEMRLRVMDVLKDSTNSEGPRVGPRG